MHEHFRLPEIRDIATAKTKRELSNRNIQVEVFGTPPNHGLLLATHPTNDDAKIFRLAKLNKFYHLVDASSLNHTLWPKLNDLIAQVYSGMIPVFSHDKDLRLKTYRAAAAKINAGFPVIIAPTGKSALHGEIPDISELKLGGIIRILQSALLFNTMVTPVLVDIDSSHINSTTGRIINGSTVKVRYGQPISVSAEFISDEVVSLENETVFKSNVIKAWEAAKLANLK